MLRFRMLRILSILIDYIIVIAIFALVMYALWGFENMGYIFIILLPWFAYTTITSVIFKGATLGQFICGIKSVYLDAEELSVFSIIWLQLIRIMYIVPFIFIPMLIQEFISLFLSDFRNLEQYFSKTKFVIKTIEKEEVVSC